METQEKSFRDLQQDERIKKLERHLKLTQIKRPNSSQLPSSSHMSISGISSIHGDNPSDLSFCSPSVASSRSGSVILASSLNFRKQLCKNLQAIQKTGPTTSSVFDQSLESQKPDEDRIMMPPPPPDAYSHRPKSSVNKGQKGQAVKSTSSKTSLLQSFENQYRIVHSSHETSWSESNVTAKNEAPQENSKQNGRVFENWTVRLNDRGQIIIKGKLENGELARSKGVKRRVSATTVHSIHNHKYHLVGDIHDVREELPEYIRGKFYNGFPMDWENVRQIWQSYVASGYSLQFRWPRPMADSDDDLISDITDLPVAHSQNSQPKPTSFVSTPRPCQTAREIDKSRKKESRSKRQTATNDLDILPIHSAAMENSASRTQTSVLETSCKNISQKKEVAQDNCLPNGGESASRTLQPNETESSKYGNLIPRWKVDVILDNMMNKNCPKEYIEKVIHAIDCINELLAPPLANNSETAPDEGVSLNYNSNGQTDTTNNKNYSRIERAETLKNPDTPRPRQSRQAATDLSDSYSLDNSAESENESPSKQSTFVCEQSVISKRNNPASHASVKSHKSRNSASEPKNLSNYSDAVERERNRSTPVKLTTKSDPRHWMNKENQNVPSLPGVETAEKSTEMERHKLKQIFDTTDDESEAQVSSKAKTISANNSLRVHMNPRRALNSRNHPAVIEKMNNGAAEAAFYDSDISIVDTCPVPGRKPKVLSIEKISGDPSKQTYQRETLCPDFSFTDNERRDHSRASSPVPRKSGNVSSEKITGPSPVPVIDRCTVRLDKIPLDQYNLNKSNCTPSKSEKTATGHRKSIIDTSYQTNELPESDAENVSMRMSSRGRHIVPPLDYWNGERLVLKGRELVYSPGKSLPASTSANSIILQQTIMSPNNTAVSEPVLGPTTAKNLNKTPTGTTNRSKRTVESKKKSTRRTGGILAEISENHYENGDHAMTSSKRITRMSIHNASIDVKKNRKPRIVTEKSDSSSEEEGVNMVRNRKRRRIH